MPTSLVIHGHFYQPPRENPWTEVVDRQPSASPHPDWNERVHAEAYRPNAFARVLDHYGRVIDIVNNYRLLSFNVGPTLMGWMQTHHPDTYGAILEADRASRLERGGHGNAIAQAYNHTILPLDNERDRRTQIRWGIADFQHRFGRLPEGMWLPETGCDDATLGVLIDEGIRFTILEPGQAERVRPLGRDPWQAVGSGNIDPGVAYRYFHRDGSGRHIDLFFYDGPISRAIAFEGALASSQVLVDRFQQAEAGDQRIIHVATDGESYGHHHREGERGLAHALQFEAPARGFRVTNYAEYLERNPPAFEVEIKQGPDGEGTAWSCAHGVGRWIRDCGCHTGGKAGWNQAWRTPLRQALNELRDHAAHLFEEAVGVHAPDPWALRDEYIHLVLEPSRDRDTFLDRHTRTPLRNAQQVRVLTWLETQRHALLMFTSCGWFFNDISGIETVQVLRYAGRLMDLLESCGAEAPRRRFLEALADAKSNDEREGTGADIYRRWVEPSRVSTAQVAANVGISSLATDDPRNGTSGGYRFQQENRRREQHGRLTLATSHLTLISTRTRERHEFAVAALHFGGIDFYCVHQPYEGAESFKRASERLWSVYHKASLPTILRVAQETFGPSEYGLEHLLPEAREQISRAVFGELVDQFAEHYSRLYQDHRRTLDLLQEAGFDLPAELRVSAEFTLGRRFEEEIRDRHRSRDPAAYRKAIGIATEVARRGYQIDRSFANRIFGEMITDAVLNAVRDPTDDHLRAALDLVALTERLGTKASLDRAQEVAIHIPAEVETSLDLMRELCRHLGLAPADQRKNQRADPRS